MSAGPVDHGLRTLIVAVGNPSRGDDALGPLLAAGVELLPPPAGVRVLVDFQLQVEHALELRGADRVLFIDAAQGQSLPCVLRRLRAAPGRMAFSHALAPEAVLAVFEQLESRPAPPAWVLGVAGEGFELGAGLSALAQSAFAQAQALLQALLAPRSDWAALETGFSCCPALEKTG